jgi:uncharacterized protein (DUF433 family)
MRNCADNQSHTGFFKCHNTFGFKGYLCYFWFVAQRISIKPNICNGRPVVRGTRITVQTVLEFLAAGDSIEDVLEEFPKLTRADVQACLNYASRLMGNHYSVMQAA